MDRPEPVTTARAAEIVGIGYEGLRSLLKRGFLKNVGVLVPFSAPETPAEELYAKRWTWKKFGQTDLCLMRLGKALMDGGLSFDDANSIVGRQEMWNLFAHQDTDHFVAVLPEHRDFWLLSSAEFDDFKRQLTEFGGAALVVSLAGIESHVSRQLALDPVSA